MATKTLNTVLSIIGGEAYIRNLNKAALSHQKLAAAEKQHTAANREMMATLGRGGRLSSGLINRASGGGVGAAQAGVAAAEMGIVGGAALVGIGALAEGLKSAIDTFATYDRSIIQTQQLMKNMGNSFPTGELADFARSTALANDVTQTNVMQGISYLARFRSDMATMKRAAVDFAQIQRFTGQSMEEIGKTFEKARTGHAREAFSEIGLMVKGVNGQLYSLGQLLDMTEPKIKGMAAAFKGTLPGALDQSKTALEDLRIQFGRLTAPAVTPIVGSFNETIQRWSGLMKLAADAHGAHLGPGGEQSAMPGFNKQFKNRSEEYLRAIEMNTGPQGHLGRALRAGGSFGDIGHGAYIRDFNAMMRHT